MSRKEHGIAGILLAAGSGTRYGGDKLLHRLPDGTPLAVAAAVNLRPACDRMVAVLRPEQEELAALLIEVGCEIIVCRESIGGMGYSLAAGVQATNNASAWIVALGDMPLIRSTTHQAVAERLRSGASLVASEYRGRRGHPVGFSGEWFDQLIAMTGDQGGRTILEQNREALILCPVDDPGATQDFDYKEDLKNIPSYTTSV
jgi:molybdenum cofactor cytidylyltransferase